MATEIERLREELKSGGRLRRYLEATGRQILPGGQLRCPNPSAHANGDAKPSVHLYEDASGDRVKCFACGGSWDIFSLVEMDEGTDFMGALESLAAAGGWEARAVDVKAHSFLRGDASAPPSKPCRRL